MLADTTIQRLAAARGDGESFALGDRVIQDVTGTTRSSAQRWRAQLVTAGLIGFQRQWAHKRGWFWEARTSLVFCAPSGPQMRPSLYGNPTQKTGTRPREGGSLRSGVGCAATPGLASDAADAARKGGKASNMESDAGGPRARTDDAKGASGDVNPGRIIPDAEAARRIREIAEKLRCRG